MSKQLSAVKQVMRAKILGIGGIFLSDHGE